MFHFNASWRIDPIHVSGPINNNPAEGVATAKTVLFNTVLAATAFAFSGNSISATVRQVWSSASVQSLSFPSLPLDTSWSVNPSGALSAEAALATSLCFCFKRFFCDFDNVLVDGAAALSRPFTSAASPSAVGGGVSAGDALDAPNTLSVAVL